MLHFCVPRYELKSYISKIWIYESEIGRMPDNNLIAPNAKPKIIIPYLNSITTTDSKNSRGCKQGDIYFIGVRDVPVLLTTPRAKTGSIGIELTTAGAYRFSNIPMREFANDLFSFSDCFGQEGTGLRERLSEIENPYGKVDCVQEFLLKQLIKQNRSNSIVDYSINLISQKHGLLKIKELERKTGYSRRYLDLLFRDYLGISPKTLSTIVRFQRFYRVLANNALSLPKNDIYEFYYDEAHFIKEFKRYTGYSPSRFANLSNEFGKHF